ncbi:hypothetical protein MVEN_02372600 [Mycena venus]|uniref:DUF6699 domain-containing protein n=1 Tax=Mycena venus TaxID=2733690 RepID=A0A8H6X291_9AGAR|nr:hypothetical protein MVEN_02372600 [Mycena venus]
MPGKHVRFSGLSPVTPPPSFIDIPEPPFGRLQAHNLIAFSNHPVLKCDMSLHPSSISTHHAGLSDTSLTEPAVYPPQPAISLVTPHLPWRIDVPASNGVYVTVRDVLNSIYHNLRTNVTAAEFDALGTQRLMQRVSAAYKQRCERLRGHKGYGEEQAMGIKRVDFLMGYTRLQGISPTAGAHDIWQLSIDSEQESDIDGHDLENAQKNPVQLDLNEQKNSGNEEEAGAWPQDSSKNKDVPPPLGFTPEMSSPETHGHPEDPQELNNLSSSSSLVTSDVGSTTEPVTLTFVVYLPDKVSNDATAVRPQDVKMLEDHFANVGSDGGTTFSIHNSDLATLWVEQHYETALLKSIRTVGVGGPLATMMTPDIPALAIFGSILDDRVLELAKILCDTSKFAVMVRPPSDNPLLTFMSAPADLELGSIEGSDEGATDDSGESEMEASGDSHGESDSNDNGGSVRRLRGGGRSNESLAGPHEDSGRIVPQGILRPDGVHRTDTTLHLQVNDECLYEMEIGSKMRFKFQTQFDEGNYEMTDPLSRPQVISFVDLKVVTRPVEVLVERSYSNLGFVVKGKNSIAGHEYLARGFDQPTAVATNETQKSTQNIRSLAAGVQNMKPTVTGTYAHAHTRGETVKLADNKPVPPCYVEGQAGKKWNSEASSCSSYDVAWHPMSDAKGIPNPAKIQFGMGIELSGKEECVLAKLPGISHFLRNQIVIWVHDPELAARTRGMIVLTTTYLADVRISDAAEILQEETIDLTINRLPGPPLPRNVTPAVPEAADSLSVALLDKTQRKEHVKGAMKKLISKITSKSKSTKPALIDLPLYEYVARGWDATNKVWRNTVWPTLDQDFVSTDRPASTAWHLIDPGAAPTELNHPEPLEEQHVEQEPAVAEEIVPSTVAQDPVPARWKGKERELRLVADDEASIDGNTDGEGHTLLTQVHGAFRATQVPGAVSEPDTGSSASDFVGGGTLGGGIHVTLPMGSTEETDSD